MSTANDTRGNLTTSHLSVSGMSCNHCTMTVTEALMHLQGVARVEVDLGPGSVTVEHDASRVTLEQLRTAIEELGYVVR